MKPTVGSITRYLLRCGMPLAPASPAPGSSREDDIAATACRSSWLCQGRAEWSRRGQLPASLPRRNCDTCQQPRLREWRFRGTQLREIASSANDGMPDWLAASDRDENVHLRPPRKRRHKARPRVATNPPSLRTHKQCLRESLCRCQRDWCLGEVRGLLPSPADRNQGYRCRSDEE